MNEDLRRDLRSLLEYNWYDEKSDYEENPSEDHIFVAMTRLKIWLNSEDN